MSNIINAENRFPQYHGNNADLFGLPSSMWAKYWTDVQEDNAIISWGAVMFWNAFSISAQLDAISDEEYEERSLLGEIAIEVFSAQCRNNYFYEDA